jgi:hypothetical protein
VRTGLSRWKARRALGEDSRRAPREHRRRAARDGARRRRERRLEPRDERIGHLLGGDEANGVRTQRAVVQGRERVREHDLLRVRRVVLGAPLGERAHAFEEPVEGGAVDDQSAKLGVGRQVAQRRRRLGAHAMKVVISGPRGSLGGVINGPTGCPVPSHAMRVVIRLPSAVAAASGTQRHSAAIRGTRRLSVALNGYQRHSAAIRGT